MVYTAVSRTSMSVETIYNAVIWISKPVDLVYKAVIRSKYVCQKHINGNNLDQNVCLNGIYGWYKYQ